MIIGFAERFRSYTDLNIIRIFITIKVAYAVKMHYNYIKYISKIIQKLQ